MTSRSSTRTNLLLTAPSPWMEFSHKHVGTPVGHQRRQPSAGLELGAVAQARAEVIHKGHKALVQRHLGRPPERLPRLRDVGLPALGIVRGQRVVHVGRGRLGDSQDLVGQLLNRELPGVAQVDGADLIAVHEADEGIHHVRHIAEAARLRTLAIQRDGLARERLHHKVGHHSAIIFKHARAVRVEDARHPDGHPVLLVV
mmetsp:Transcript_14162/g.36142  ORF Transcript_14162/g.36142 Transcript_14162/m.36142 type:complete len:200 (+) Transcript_14162:69-668(+)